MTKAELVEKIQKDNGGDLSKKAVTSIIDAVFDNLAKAIKKDKRFGYPGFGTFTVRRRVGRIGRNPQTGAQIKIAPSRTVRFKPAPELKKSL